MPNYEDTYPGGVLEKYILNPFVDYVLWPPIQGTIDCVDKIKEISSKMLKGLVKKLSH